MIHTLSALELGRRLRARELGALEVAEHFLDRIETLDAKLGAFLCTDRTAVMAGAQRAQEVLDEGGGGPLTGVPVALKDNLMTRGLPTTCASKILEGYVPQYDAHVVERLAAEGCVILGKTNMDEFAMGTSTETSAYKSCRNPWDLSRSPGGSSGGSAAAVAAGLAPLALGSDTGGSIRQPAALVGAVGFKPTYGRCSRYGLIAFASSLDQIGPFATSVEDAAALATTITGHDPRDSTSARIEPVRLREERRLRGKRVGLPRELFSSNADPGVLECVMRAVDQLREAGLETVEVSLPAISYGVTTYYIIAPAEASSNLARFDGIRYGPSIEGEDHIANVALTRGTLFGHEVKQRIIIGTYALSAGYYDAFYVRAQQVRQLMTRQIEETMAEVDALLSPTSPVVAFPIGELSSDPLALKLLDYCTIPANMGGFPAISFNCGFSQGLPVGMQLIGRTNGDDDLLALAYSVEQALPDARRLPELA